MSIKVSIQATMVIAVPGAIHNIRGAIPFVKPLHPASLNKSLATVKAETLVSRTWSLVLTTSIGHVTAALVAPAITALTARC
jgi:hypothetical protein